MPTTPSVISNPVEPDFESLLRRFGLAAFRPGQREVIEAAFREEDILAVMPTGAGKSLCYQLPALGSCGLTVVVSPLIALMKDQVEALLRRGIRAASLTSQLSHTEQERCLAQLGTLRLLYLSPERLGNTRVQRALLGVGVARFIVDEAHCISGWGHDFRPDYRQLGRIRVTLGNPPVTALTATATEAVRDDIAALLELRDPVRVLTGFDRPNLRYRVLPVPDERAREEALYTLLERASGPCIVYAGTRERTETTAQKLLERGFKSAAYHAGLDAPTRNAVQEAFLVGRVDVMVATNAFGMGVDKADVAGVVHLELPASLEAYYQEAGRAGRGGQRATCTLLYADGDADKQKGLLRASSPTLLDLKRAYLKLRNAQPEGVSTEHLDLNRGKLIGTVQLLEDKKIAAVLREGRDVKLSLRPAFTRALPDFQPAWITEYNARRKRLLEEIIRYADLNSCRRNRLLGYFGDAQSTGACGCDVCRPEPYLTNTSLATLAQFRRPRRRKQAGETADWFLRRGFLELRRGLLGRRYTLSQKGKAALGSPKL